MPYDPSFWVPSSPSRGAWSSSSPALPMQNFRYMYLAAVVVREGGKRSLGFPGHVGVGVTEAVFEYLDHAVTGHVKVLTRVATVRQDVGCEGTHERGVDAFGVEDVQQIAQVRGLFVLVAGVVAMQPDRFGTVPFDDHPATSAQVGRAAVGGAPELGDRDGLSPSDEGTDAVAVPVGDLLRSISIEGDEVEGRPVDALERDRGVADLPSKTLANERLGLAEEGVHASRDLRHQLAQPHRPRQQPEPLVKSVAGHEPLVEQAQLGSSDEEDLSSSLAQLLGALGTVGEQVEQFVGGQVVSER